VLEGQINSALRFLSETTSGGVLSLTDEVMSQLKQKHPNPQSAKLGSLLFGPIDDQYPESVYTEINGEMVRQAALRTKGAGGPSGVDANGFRRILACKSFKQSSTRLCEAIATMTRTLCTQYIDPMTIEPLVANRLIPLDKGEGAVRPIGVGEVLRRICGKCVMSVVKKDVVDASGSLQLCAGQKQPARLFVIGGKEIVSAEGTTQGDPLAMGLYALSIQPLITSLQAASSVKQCWFADDASGAGSIMEIRTWWDALSTLGPDFGYFPNDRKCWIIAKPAKEESVREAFKDTSINVTVQGQKHLGAAIGSREYLEEYVSEKVTNWINDIAKLAEFALSQPQACYAAYTFGLKHRWTYFLRTLPDIQDLLEPLEDAISHMLIPAITERKCTQLDRNILALPVRLGGLGLGNPSLEARREYASSVKVTKPLVEQIVSQSHQLPEDSLTKLAQQEVRSERSKELEHRAERIKEMAPRKTQRALDLATEKGSSAWLTLRDLEAEFLSMVCSDVEIEPVLQDISGEHLNRGSNKAQDARLDIHARGF
ncbi:unnamed protein product, partial [Porites lobata]